MKSRRIRRESANFDDRSESLIMRNNVERDR